MLPVLLQQCSRSNVEHPHTALVKPTGQLMAVWVVGTALDDLAGCCQLKELCMGGDVPAADGAV